MQILSGRSVPFNSDNQWGYRKVLGEVYAKEKVDEESIEDLLKFNLSPLLKRNLYGFQLDGVRYGLKSYGRFLLADEMGVGKTVQAIAITHIYRNEWPLYIICPSFLKFVWRQELKRWLSGSLREDEIQIFQHSKDNWDINAKVYIMSYEIASKKGEELVRMKPRVCIADEAHYLKSRSSKRSQSLVPIL